MSESNTEPHVSGQELRAALATSGRSRPNPLMSDAPPAEAAPAWEWTTDEQAEVTELRESTAALAAEIEELRGTVDAARTREHELREALLQLSAARPWQRRGVVAELAGRGLL
jgi:type II secretory pathway component PulL